ncbi:MAG: hypothetical protein ABSE73_01185 [Planctomycetota bacterium]
MVDRDAREKAAQLLQQFKAGLISNDRFEDGWPLTSQDPVLEAIRWTVWGSYDDLHEHRLGERNWVFGSNKLDSDGQALFERCILFLKSDLVFDPQTALSAPPRPNLRPLRAASSLVLTGGALVLFMFYGFSPRTAGLLMLWGLLWILLYHFAEHAVCRPPEGWSIGTVFWPFASKSDYEGESARYIR